MQYMLKQSWIDDRRDATYFLDLEASMLATCKQSFY